MKITDWTLHWLGLDVDFVKDDEKYNLSISLSHVARCLDSIGKLDVVLIYYPVHSFKKRIRHRIERYNNVFDVDDDLFTLVDNYLDEHIIKQIIEDVWNISYERDEYINTAERRKVN